MNINDPNVFSYKKVQKQLKKQLQVLHSCFVNTTIAEKKCETEPLVHGKLENLSGGMCSALYSLSLFDIYCYMVKSFCTSSVLKKRP